MKTKSWYCLYLSNDQFLLFLLRLDHLVLHFICLKIKPSAVSQHSHVPATPLSPLLLFGNVSLVLNREPWTTGPSDYPTCGITAMITQATYVTTFQCQYATVKWILSVLEILSLTFTRTLENVHNSIIMVGECAITWHRHSNSPKVLAQDYTERPLCTSHFIHRNINAHVCTQQQDMSVTPQDRQAGMHYATKDSHYHRLRNTITFWFMATEAAHGLN